RPPAPHQVNADVPEEVSALVMRLLAEAPEQRPASARQVARQLRALEAPPAVALHLSGSGSRPGRPRAPRGVVAAGGAGVLAGRGVRVGAWGGGGGRGGEGRGPTGRGADAGALSSGAAWQEGESEAWRRARKERLRLKAGLSSGDASRGGAQLAWPRPGRSGC